jgi:hypothetical protein
MLAVSGIAAAGQITQSQVIELPGEPPVFVPQTETPKLNVSTIGLRISSDFDDNALNSQQDHHSDFAVIIQPQLGWRVSKTRLDWAVDYTMGLSRSQEFAAYDSLSHLLDSRFQVRLTKRLRFRVHEAYLNSTNPFDQLQASETATDPTARIVPSESATLTPDEVRTNLSSVDVAYALSAHSAVGVSGEFFGATYSLPSGALSSNQPLQNSSSTAGHAYYMRQATRNQWVSLDYRVQKSTFDGGQSSFVRTLAYTHTIALFAAATLSFFVGPERSVTQNVTGAFSSSSLVLSGTQPAWEWSGGVIGRWSGKHTTVSATLSRRINNGGLLGPAELATSSAELSRQFAPHWTTRLLASSDHSKALVGPSRLFSTSVAGTLIHTLGPSLSLEVQYWRVHMSSNSSLPPALLADHNRISMSLVFEHSHMLGR